jgi:leucine dehydrogenase
MLSQQVSEVASADGLFGRIERFGHEQLVFCFDRSSGLHGIIAIHNTTLGPALGGIRMRPYPSEDDALQDVLRLSRAMTFKAAMAGLNLGGGKSVIVGDPHADKSEALFRAMGRYIQSLAGRYVAATDIGTTVDDLISVRMETPYVTGLPEAWGGLGDTSILTGLTVYLGMKAGAAACWGSDSLAGKRVMVQGTGKVGTYLLGHLQSEGAQLLVSDVLGESVQRAADRFHAEIVPPEDVYDVECDIFSPNALGAILTDDTIPRLRCKLVCGGANNQLSEDRHGDVLHARGILYAPDYVVNSGGVISGECELLHAPLARAEALARRVGATTARVFATAARERISPSAAADRLAMERIEQVSAARHTYIPTGGAPHPPRS